MNRDGSKVNGEGKMVGSRCRRMDVIPTGVCSRQNLVGGMEDQERLTPGGIVQSLYFMGWSGDTRCSLVVRP